MPSLPHQLLAEVVRQRPVMVVDLLFRVLGIRLPKFSKVRLEPADIIDLVPTALSADAVVLTTATDRPVYAVVVEVQLSGNPDKWWTWPVHVISST